MDRNSESSTSLEWENLAVFGGKPMEFPLKIDSHFSIYSSGSNDDFGKVVVGEPMIGLRLGSQVKESGGNVFPLGSNSRGVASSISSSSMPMKRSRASYQNMQNPCCQVEGCNLDLKLAKDYHRRHRICENHSKSPKVTVAGMERRFCQQCSRFHDLSEFDDKKRSCRKRLSDHNARRRRQQPSESIQFSPTGFSSALYDQRQQSMLLSGLPITVSNSTWENADTSMSGHARDLLLRPPKAGGFDRTLSYSSDEIPSSLSDLYMDSNRLSSVRSSCPRVLDQCNSSIAPDHPNAHSLLSTNSWSSNEPESMSMDCLVPGNYNNNPLLMRLSDPHQWSLFDSNNTNIAAEAAEQSGNPFSMNLHNPSGASSHLQEYQLFKAPYDSACFYSPQR